MSLHVADPRLSLVGLGPGPVELLTLQAWELLASGKPLMIRQPEHEAAQMVLARGFSFERAPGGGVGQDPQRLAEHVVAWARRWPDSVYAFPGHPLDAPETAHLLDAQARGDVHINLVPAIPASAAMEADHDPATGTEILPSAQRAGAAFARLAAIMSRLRAPGGCPWDAEQTHSSLAIHLLEEAYETLDAIDRGDMQHLEEELGDLLLQVVFHAELAKGDGNFDIGGVIERLMDKLITRHPHVFGDVLVGGADDVVVNWEVIKRREKARSSPVEGIPRNLPSLLLVHKLQRRAAGVGKAGPPPTAERIAELADAAASGRAEGATDTQDVVGELLYQVVALAQQAGVDPEGALRKRANDLLDELGATSAQATPE
jgi:MazG family protein